jgi:hypothetical protein
MRENESEPCITLSPYCDLRILSPRSNGYVLWYPAHYHNIMHIAPVWIKQFDAFMANTCLIHLHLTKFV